MPDTEPIKHTTASFSFNMEVSDPLSSYVRLLNLDIAFRTITFSH